MIDQLNEFVETARPSPAGFYVIRSVRSEDADAGQGKRFLEVPMHHLVQAQLPVFWGQRLARSRRVVAIRSSWEAAARISDSRSSSSRWSFSLRV